jgi:hypothetical protein
LTRELSDCRIARRIDAGSTNDFVLVLTNSAAEFKLSAWTTTTNTHTVTFNPNISGITGTKAVTATGEATEVSGTGGQLRIELAAAPKYITLIRPGSDAP